MKDENYFDDVLSNVRKAVEKNGDLTDALENNLSDMLHGCLDQPLDSGIRRFRSLSISRQDGPTGSGERLRSAWLLSVRGIDEAGCDVIAWSGADSWIECVVNFCHHAATNAVEWKPDRKPSDRKRSSSFFDSIATSDNGDNSDGINFRRGRSKEKGGLGPAAGE